MLTVSRRAAEGGVRWLVCLAFGAFAFSPLAAQQEVASSEPVTLYVTSATEEAVNHFWAGLHDTENIFFPRSANHFQKALELDPDLGLARVFYGWGAPGLTQAERSSEIARGIGSLGGATTAEVIVATALKELNANNTSAAKQLFGVAADMVPDDPHVAYLHAWVSGFGSGNQFRGITAQRKVTERFPDFAAAYNILGYGLWATGDHQGGLEAIRKYVELEADHPNPHDSYAELLQWDGRLEEATKHYRKAIELDESYTAAYHGLAEVNQLQGNKKETISYLTQAIDHAATPQARINFRRALANGYLINGDRKAAMENLAVAAEEAAANEFNGPATFAHQQMAVVDAMDKGRNIATHLDAAAAINGADTPAQHAWTAIAYAVAGEVAQAREAATALEKAAADAPNWQTASHAANAMVYLLEDRADDALAELEQADPTNDLIRVLTGECYLKMGNKDEAKTFKTDVLANRQFNIFNAFTALARVRAEKL